MKEEKKEDKKRVEEKKETPKLSAKDREIQFHKKNLEKKGRKFTFHPEYGKIEV